MGDKKKLALGMYSVAHLLVDWICVGGVLALSNLNDISGEQAYIYILLYNLIAFGSQPFIGFYADERRLSRLFGAFGMTIVAASVTLVYYPVLFVLMAGFGNAMFHVGGGIYSLYFKEDRATAPGIFVAPGAIGVFLGTAYSGLVGESLYVYIAIALIVINWFVYRMKAEEDIVYCTQLPDVSGSSKFYLIIASLFTVIMFRGIIGGGLFLEWKTTTALKILVLAAIVLGKGLGGILGDRYGFEKVGLGGLVLALPLLTASKDNVLLATIGLFAFNMTMPITLTLLASTLKKYKGFAFGLTTLALIVGYFLDIVRDHFSVSGGLVVMVGITVSIACMYLGLYLIRPACLRSFLGGRRL